jgi:hypothetical protein
MKFLTDNRWIAWVLIIAGGIAIGASCFDSGVTDLDDTRILQPVCGDLPQGDPRVLSGDCVQSRDVLDTNRAVDSWPVFVLGLVLLAFGLALLTGQGPFKRPAVTQVHKSAGGGAHHDHHDRPQPPGAI